VFDDCAADVGGSAFSGCTKLANVDLGSKVKTIGNSAFYNSGLVTLTIPASLTSIGTDVFYNCTLLESINVIAQNLNYASVDGVLFNKATTTLIKYPAKRPETGYEVPAGVTNISISAFNGCTILKYITFPASLIDIAAGNASNGTFVGCTNLASVTFVDSIANIGNYAFYNLQNLIEVSLGSKIKTIGNYAFYGCAGLTSIAVSGSVASIGTCAFQSCTGLSSVHLEEGVLGIGDYAFAACRNLASIDIPWSVNSIGNNTFNSSPNVTIYTWWGSYAESYAIARSIPVRYFENEAASLELSLPAPVNSGQYDNMKITLINKTKNTQFSVSVTDKLSYSFRGLSVGDIYRLTLTNRHGYVISEIDNIAVLEGVNSVSFTDLLQTTAISLSVSDDEGTLVTTQCTVQWYDENDNYLTQGGSIFGIVVGAKLKYKIELNSALGSKYTNPIPADFVAADGNNSIEITLLPIPAATISGTVTNAQTGAAISVSQMLNGKYPQTVTATADSNGVFSVQVFNCASTITASSNNFINRVIHKSSFDGDENIGEIGLSPISGARITLSMGFTYAATPGETPVQSTLYYDYLNLQFEVYNQTQGKTITDFIYQYPYIILPNDASANDTIRVSVAGGKKDFNPVHTTVALDSDLKASATLDMVQHGSLKGVLTSSANNENVALVYNASGKLVTAYDFRFTNVSTDHLPDGNYSVIFMGKSLFFDSIQRISDLAAARLVQSVDYARRQVAISSGVVTLVEDISIPRFDESKFYYTDNFTTSFTVNKTSAVVGSYFTLRSQVAFRDTYSDQVSDVKLLIKLPDNCIFFENSVLLGTNNTLASYLLEGDMLTIPLINMEDVVRFCVIPEQVGTYSPNAFVEFVLGGETIRQPIGTAGFEATNSVIRMPDITGLNTVLINGTTMPDSDVIIYDNGVAVAQTKSNLNGSWAVAFDINKPYSLSYHNIYAEVHMSNGINVLSETRSLMYNVTYIDLSTVTMIYNNSKSVFDFINPSTKEISYVYWSGIDSFTFIIEFTDNDPDLISDVFLNVLTTSDKVFRLPATYDEVKRLWVTSGTFDIRNMPVSVNVDYINSSEEALYDRDFINDLTKDIDEAIEIYNVNSEYIDATFALINAEFEKDTPDFGHINQLNRDLENRLGIRLDFVTDGLDDVEFEALLNSLSEEELLEFFDLLIYAFESIACEIEKCTGDLAQYLPMSIYGEMDIYIEDLDINATIATKPCDGLSDAGLVSQGFTQSLTTDGSSVYTQITETSFEIIDFKTDLFQTITFDNNSSMSQFIYSEIDAIMESIYKGYRDEALINLAAYTVKTSLDDIQKSLNFNSRPLFLPQFLRVCCCLEFC
jgi:hypothetical protein